MEKSKPRVQSAPAVDSSILRKKKKVQQHKLPFTKTQGRILAQAFEKNQFHDSVTRKKRVKQTGIQELMTSVL
jgi:hypothetical protein